MNGYWMPVLHAHLPFVKHPQYDYFLEEQWLFEAISETYLPLLMALSELEKRGVPFHLTTSVTPPLCEMLADEQLQMKYERHLLKLIELSEKEVTRTKGTAEEALSVYYLDRFKTLQTFYSTTLKWNVLNGYRYFQQKGMLEIITCGATHGFLPFLQERAIRAQLEVAVENYQKHFGQRPIGIWLPECAYVKGLEQYLLAVGIHYFFVDTHGLLYACPVPQYGVFAPCCCHNGVAVFARDVASSKSVWSSKEGYPGDPYYRDFYRDIGYDLPFDYIAPYISPDGLRQFTGLKYHRITGETDQKQLYDPQMALARTKEHAKDFVYQREVQVQKASLHMDRPPLIVSPYDAELFGHWWFEGPLFLKEVFIEMAKSTVVTPVTAPIYLNRHPSMQVVNVNPSSWGDGGAFDVWLNEGNKWIYPHLHQLGNQMEQFARQYATVADELSARVLNQMARELLLAQSSDWAFLMTTGTASEYSIKRTTNHMDRFLVLAGMLANEEIDTHYLADLERSDSIFPEIDFRTYA